MAPLTLVWPRNHPPRLTKGHSKCSIALDFPEQRSPNKQSTWLSCRIFCHRVMVCVFLELFCCGIKPLDLLPKMNMIWRMDHLIALINKCYLFSHLLRGSGSKNWPVCWREMMVHSRDLEGPAFMRWTMTLEGRLFLCHVGNLNWVAEGWYGDGKVWGWQ